MALPVNVVPDTYCILPMAQRSFEASGWSPSPISSRASSLNCTTATRALSGATSESRLVLI